MFIASVSRGIAAASAALLIGAVAAGCGGEDSDTDDSQSDASEHDDHDHHGDDDHAEHDMGDPSLTPAYDIADAELREGELQLVDVPLPDGYDDAGGTVWVAQHDGGTTVTVEATGLVPDTEYMSHLHVSPCDDDWGGPHFQFDTDGDVMPPNEIHLALTSDSDGEAMSTVENDRQVEDGANSLVIHPEEEMSHRIVCGDF